MQILFFFFEFRKKYRTLYKHLKKNSYNEVLDTSKLLFLLLVLPVYNGMATGIL